MNDFNKWFQTLFKYNNVRKIIFRKIYPLYAGKKDRTIYLERKLEI